MAEDRRDRREILSSERRFYSLFEESPVSLWEEDIGDLLEHLQSLGSEGVSDFEEYFRRHPDEVPRCMSMIRVLAVNRATLELYEAPDEGSLLAGLDRVFTHESFAAFSEILVALAERRGACEIEGTNRTLAGRPLTVKLKWSLLRDTDGRQTRALVSVEDVTERRRAAEELRETQSRLVKAQQIANFGSWDWNVATGEVVWSDEVYRLYGLKPGKDRPTYQVVVDTLTPECRERFLKAVEGALEGEPFEGEYIIESLDGVHRYTHTTGEVTFDEDGKPVRMFGVVQDITARKRAEQALQQSEEKYRLAMEATTDGLWDWNVLTNEVYYSPAWARILGEEEVFHDFSSWAGRIHPDDAEEALRSIRRHLEGETKHWRLEHRLRTGSGEWKWVLGRGRVVDRDEEGAPRRMIGTMTDISERKHAERMLRESESMLRQSQRVAGVGHYVFDVAAGRWTSSEMLEEIFGIGPDYPRTVEGWLDLVHAEQREEMSRYLAGHILRDGRRFDREYRVVRRSDGTVRWVHGLGKLELGADGQVLRMFGTIQDITERKEGEERLRKSEEKFRAIVETTREWIWSCNVEGVHTYSNDAVRDMLGYDPEEVVGRPAIQLMHPEDVPAATARMQEALEKRQGWSSLVLRWRHRDGTLRIFESTASPIIGRDGSMLGWYGADRDITERRLLEEERLKSQKLESIGTLAGGIAHDFNNLLQGVFGHISMARLTYDRKEECLSMLEQAEKALHQTVNLTNQLLTFSKGGRPVKEAVSLQPLIENAARFSLSGSSARFEIRAPADLWCVSADRGQISQVIQNIVLNADQAMPGGGSIAISARNITAGGELPPGLKPGEFVAVTIGDTGTGIPEKDLKKIFDPYFTTKEKGSGLGLATSYSIVRNHEGTIEVRSGAGRGSEFTIYLPAIRERAKRPASAAAAASAPAPTRRARILVMDDEEMVRNVSAKLIGALGHECDLAEGGETAIAKYRAAREEGRPFDIVILDLTIKGGMGGAETIGRLMEIDPQVKAIVSSGYSDDGVASGYREKGFRRYLKKPYNVRELREALDSLLA